MGQEETEIYICKSVKEQGEPCMQEKVGDTVRISRMYGSREIEECLKDILRCRDRQKKEGAYEQEKGSALSAAFKGR